MEVASFLDNPQRRSSSQKIKNLASNANKHSKVKRIRVNKSKLLQISGERFLTVCESAALKNGYTHCKLRTYAMGI